MNHQGFHRWERFEANLGKTLGSCWESQNGTNAMKDLEVVSSTCLFEIEGHGFQSFCFRNLLFTLNIGLENQTTSHGFLLEYPITLVSAYCELTIPSMIPYHLYLDVL